MHAWKDVVLIRFTVIVLLAHENISLSRSINVKDPCEAKIIFQDDHWQEE